MVVPLMLEVPSAIRRKLWWARRAERQMLKHLKWKVWKKEQRQRRLLTELVTVYRGGQQKRIPAVGRVTMPQIFCLDRKVDETLQFLTQVRQGILSKAVELQERRTQRNLLVNGYFDFTTMHSIGVSAALILGALYDRQKTIAGFRLSTINEHLWHPDVHFVLGALGFHQLLDMQPKRGSVTKIGGLKILRMRSGTNADGSTVGFIQEALGELLPDDEREKLLYAEPYAGIFEAILNSHSWAYPSGGQWDFPQVERWWITGLVDTENKTVSFAVYDQGVSIPVSLPHWRHAGELRNRLERLSARLGIGGGFENPRNDGLALALAVKLANTSTQLPQHGKGLLTMIEVAQRARVGRLRILSRYGEYVWETGEKPTNRAMPYPLHGTLVEWTLDL